MTKIPPKDDWTKLEGRVSAADIRGLGSKGAIEKLSLTKMPTLTAKVAQGLSSLQSVDELWLWCDVTRTAMRHVIAVPGLRILDILKLVKPGRLEPFSAASNLEVFRGNHYLSEEDLLQVVACRSLRELGAQGAGLSPRAIKAILDLPKLESLDLEGSAFTDAMAEELSASTSLRSLDVGATRITRTGLSSLCKMRQLRSLNAISSLKRVWLDGVKLDPQHRASLEARYESVRIT